MYNICLVEDEKDLNNLIKNYLNHEGYNVIPVYNGKDTFTVKKETEEGYQMLEVPSPCLFTVLA